MKTKIQQATKVVKTKKPVTEREPARQYVSVASLPNIVANSSVAVFKKAAKDKMLADMSDVTFVTRMKSSMSSDAAFEYAAKLQGQFDEHKQVLRCAFTMKQTWSDSGTWSIIDSAWEFNTKRVLNNANDRNSIIQMNRLRINLQINWTNDTVVTKKQIPMLRSATNGGFQVWSCLRHDKNGATAIMLRNLAENTFMIVYEDGTYTKSFGVYRLMGDEWPTVAKMERDTLKSRELAAKVMEVSAGGAVSINRYAKSKK